MKKFLLVLSSLLLIPVANAQVEVKQSWARTTVPLQKSTGVFLQLRSETDRQLVQVRSPVAGIAELHAMTMKDGIMQMRQVSAIELPAGQVVELASGGYHIMLMELKKQIVESEAVPLTLIFEDRSGKREELDITVIAR